MYCLLLLFRIIRCDNLHNFVGQMCFHFGISIIKQDIVINLVISTVFLMETRYREDNTLLFFPELSGSKITRNIPIFVICSGETVFDFTCTVAGINNMTNTL